LGGVDRRRRLLRPDPEREHRDLEQDVLHEDEPTMISTVATVEACRWMMRLSAAT
jgi:hypothetical protein